VNIIIYYHKTNSHADKREQQFVPTCLKVVPGKA